MLIWLQMRLQTRRGSRRPLQSRHRSRPDLCHPASHHQPLLAADAQLEERPLGCGWFDSSHELERGLSVQEGDDAALSALPLAAWLEWQQPRQQPLRSQQLPLPQQPSPPSQSRQQRRLDSAPATAGPDTPWVLLPI